MKTEITALMLVKNSVQGKGLPLLTKVVEQTSKITKEILVIDNGSEDDTVKQLKLLQNKLQLNMEIVEDKNKNYNSLRVKYAKKKIKTRYVLVVDDDEIATEGLIRCILREGRKYHIVNTKWNTYMHNKKLLESRRIYLVDLKNVELNKNITGPHQGFVSAETFKKIPRKYILRPKEELKHYSFKDVETLVKKTKRYAKAESEVLFMKNPKLNTLQVVFLLLFEVIRQLTYRTLLQKGYKTKLGMFFSLHNAISYEIDKYLFYVELQMKNKER